jgi:hypothetical protein
MQLRKRVFLTVLAIASGIQMSPVQAAVVGGAQGRVTEYSLFSEYGGGDVIFKFTGAISGCDGFWLRPTDPGFEHAFSILKTAYETGKPLRVWVHDDSNWDGSANIYCRVYRLNPITPV